MEMSVAGMGTLVKQKFNGESGYAEQQGMKINMSDKEVAKLKEQAIFPELNFTEDKMSLASIVSVEGKDAYKLEVNTDAGVSTRYYSVETGLLMRTEETTEMQGQNITQTSDVSDYREVNGVMLPFKTVSASGPQKFEMNTTEMLINEGVSASDFE